MRGSQSDGESRACGLCSEAGRAPLPEQPVQAQVKLVPPASWVRLLRSEDEPVRSAGEALGSGVSRHSFSECVCVSMGCAHVAYMWVSVCGPC